MTSTSTTARFEQELTISWQERLWRGARHGADLRRPPRSARLDRHPQSELHRPSSLPRFLKRAAPLMILAAGQMFVIVSGEFDLSVGSLITAVVVAAAGLTEGDPDRTWWVVVALFALGIIVGLINGIVTTRLYVPSFITTLGMWLILQGAVLYWSGGAPRGSLPDNFRVFGRLGIEDVPVIEQIPYSVIMLVVVGVAAVLLLHRTTFGKQLFAAGGNRGPLPSPGSTCRGCEPSPSCSPGFRRSSPASWWGLRRHLAGCRGRLRVSGDLGRRARRRRPGRGPRIDGRRHGRGAGARGALHAAQLARLAETIARRRARADHHRRRRVCGIPLASGAIETSTPRHHERRAQRSGGCSVGRR